MHRERQIGVSAAEIDDPQPGAGPGGRAERVLHGPDELVDLAVLALRGRLDPAVLAQADEFEKGRVFRDEPLLGLVVGRGGLDLVVRGAGRDQELTPLGHPRLDGAVDRLQMGVPERDRREFVDRQCALRTVVAGHAVLRGVPVELQVRLAAEDDTADDHPLPGAGRVALHPAEGGPDQIVRSGVSSDEVCHRRWWIRCHPASLGAN